MSLIPKIIYQSWKTKELSGKMLQVVKQVKILNPEYDYYLYDDDDCRKFLLDNFGVNYANAFDVLIPGAFKCDFWRYAMLYVNGGVYLDIDMVPLVPFREMLNDNDEFVSITDMEHGVFTNLPGIYQAFIACRPKHPILLETLYLTFANISTRKIGESLSITGPIVMGTAFNLYFRNTDTYTEIQPGKYSNGIKLFWMTSKYTYDLNNRILFQNKFDGYERGFGDYVYTRSYYHDDPRDVYNAIQKYMFWFLVIFCVVSIILLYIYRKKLKICKSSCSKS